MEENMKLALVVEGGGARGAYAYGVLEALYKHYGLKYADYLTGSSASIPLLAYFASGQFNPEETRKMWTEHLSGAKAIGLTRLIKTGSFIDVDYVVDEVLKKIIPLNQEALKSSKMKLVVPLANAESGKPEYIENSTVHDFFEVLRAAMAFPILYKKTVKLGDEEYFDGGFADPLPIDYPGVKDAKKIIILTKPENYTPSQRMEKKFSFLRKKSIKPGIVKIFEQRISPYKQRLDDISHLDSSEYILIRPDEIMSKTDNREKILIEHINKGYEAAISHEGFQKFFAELRLSPYVGTYLKQ